MARRVALFLLLVLTSISADALPWRSGGPAGGRVSGLVSAPSNPDVLYALTRDALFRSGDDGATWIRSDFANVTSLTVDPQRPEVVYALREHDWNVYRSADGGATWQVIFTRPTQYTIPAAIAVDPRNSQLIYVAVDCNAWGGVPGSGIYKTTDGGTTWAHMLASGAAFCATAVAVDPQRPDTVYASSAMSEDRRSDDAGLTWTVTSTPGPATAQLNDPFVPGRRYALALDARFTWSDDAGATWHVQPRLLLASGEQMWNMAAALAIDDRTGDLFLAGRGTYRSRDRGLTWEPLPGAGRYPAGALARFMRGTGLLYDSSTTKLTVATEAGLFRSSAPWAEWLEIPLPRHSERGAGVAAHPTRPEAVYAATNYDIFQSDDSGRSWRHVAQLPFDPLDPELFDLEIDHTGEIYVGLETPAGPGVFRMPAGSTTWLNVPGPISLAGPLTIGSFTLDPMTPGTIYARGWLSRDYGATWRVLSFTGEVVLHPSEPSLVYNASVDAVFRIDLTSGTQVPIWYWERDACCKTLLISPADPSVIYVPARTVMRSSADRGNTWTEVPLRGADGSPLQFPHGTRFEIDPRNARILYAATRAEILRSDDGGETWRSLNEGLPVVFGTSIALSATGSVLHVGTARGVWHLPLAPARRRAVPRG